MAIVLSDKFKDGDIVHYDFARSKVYGTVSFFSPEAQRILEGWTRQGLEIGRGQPIVMAFWESWEGDEDSHYPIDGPSRYALSNIGWNYEKITFLDVPFKNTELLIISDDKYKDLFE